mmetsp:Transcript_46378/g.91500  ORF Transcript_46378/g.91500 Transcript_46378/m.91500 type:complete len:136 (+) Transcript_46378:153-560(+)
MNGRTINCPDAAEGRTACTDMFTICLFPVSNGKENSGTKSMNGTKTARKGDDIEETHEKEKTPSTHARMRAHIDRTPRSIIQGFCRPKRERENERKERKASPTSCSFLSLTGSIDRSAFRLLPPGSNSTKPLAFP